MENISVSSIDELVIWVITVDRRLVLMETMKSHSVVRASDIAHETSRSTQNISRALKELEDKCLIECLTPGKATWKKYVLTDRGKEVLNILEQKYL
ncbi:MAG: sugar-specific transcriptional regulator TrmB [Methanosarcinales archaeon]|nr:sugar-specific transcriptional regulator TrmB [Methanosarcinales archaeon]